MLTPHLILKPLNVTHKLLSVEGSREPEGKHTVFACLGKNRGCVWSRVIRVNKQFLTFHKPS